MQKSFFILYRHSGGIAYKIKLQGIYAILYKREIMREKTKNNIFISLIALAVVVVSLALFFGAYTLCMFFGDTSITLDSSKTYQTIQGFGASSAWIYQDMDNLEPELQDEAMELLYGDSGLMLNTFRYNIGGGSNEIGGYGEGSLNGTNSYFIADRFTGDYSVFADKSNYDFTKNAVVDDMFEQALAKGNITHVVFFANSPHYLMTKNGKTHGAVEYDNNLKEEAYGAFADYLLVCTDYLYSEIICKYDPDIKVYISPVNEPQWKWGGESASQEGCHYDPEPLGKFYDVFYDKLTAHNEQNGTDYIMDIFECGKYQMVFSSAKVKEYMKELSQYDWFKDIDNISVHSYGSDNKKTDKNMFADYMQSKFPDKTVSVSEYCVLEFGVVKTMDMGIYNAQTILRDLKYLNAVSWSWWLSVSQGDYEDGLIYWNKTDGGNEINKYKRYYVMGQFSRYVTEGSVRIEADYSDFLGFNGTECVAFSRPDGATVLIVINDSSLSREINLSGDFSEVMKVVTDENSNWEQSQSGFDGKISVSPMSVTTFVLR